MDRRTYLSAVGAALSATVFLDGLGESQTPDTPPQSDGSAAAVAVAPGSRRTVAIYVTEALARTARDTGYPSVVRPAVAVANQLGASSPWLRARLVHEPVAFVEADSHRTNWQTWRETDALGEDDAALLLTTTRDGEWDGYGGAGYAVVEAEDLIYYEGGPWSAARRNTPFAQTLAVACHEVGHAVGLTHADHEGLRTPRGDRYVTLMGVGAPDVDYDGFFMEFSEAATRRLAGSVRTRSQ
ncbi:astacin family metallopeptidase [Halorarius litoreus]|uniref:astacin family metallopeptidase n=1 Tax=Halorarius litoreus TaxID=2962676 RepID=UPI0020CE5179|nr:astacin family metallopeptidase [Halorarius litoreus]